MILSALIIRWRNERHHYYDDIRALNCKIPWFSRKDRFCSRNEQWRVRNILFSTKFPIVIEMYTKFSDTIILIYRMVAMALAYQYDVKFCRNLLEMTGDTIFKATNGAIYDKINKAKFKNDLLKLLCDMIWYVVCLAVITYYSSLSFSKHSVLLFVWYC